MGKEWDLARKTGGVTFFPPYLADERRSVNDELDGPLQRAAEFIAETSAEFIVLADSSVVYNMDYRDAIETHRKSAADVTAIYCKKLITPGETDNAVIFDIAEGGRIRSVARASNTEYKLNVSLGAYIMPKRYFLQMTSGEKNCGMLRFSRVHVAGALDRLRVIAHEFKGYTAQICSIDTFFHHNMEMLDIEKSNSLFDFGGRRIFTSRRDSLPTKYGKQAVIKNSIISDGCRIEGSVENSVLCRNVKIGLGASVRNCILQEGTVVEKNAEMDYIITDREVFITEKRSLMGYRTYPVYIERSKFI
jgi:glucose-1-phosphate adenylyltransferase